MTYLFDGTDLDRDIAELAKRISALRETVDALKEEFAQYTAVLDQGGNYGA